jgi:hypothetical protein
MLDGQSKLLGALFDRLDELWVGHILRIQYITSHLSELVPSKDRKTVAPPQPMPKLREGAPKSPQPSCKADAIIIDTDEAQLLVGTLARGNLTTGGTSGE